MGSKKQTKAVKVRPPKPPKQQGQKQRSGVKAADKAVPAAKNTKKYELAGKINQTVVVARSSLTPHPRNYRVHPDDQLVHIGESLRQFGFYRNVVVARGDVILAGHGVVQAAEKVGINDVPIFRLDIDPDSPLALKVLASDNELPRFAEVDDRILTELLKEIKDTDGLLGTGYDEQMLASLLMVTRPTSEIQDFDAAAHWMGMPAFEPGEPLYKLVVQFRSEADRVEFVDKFKIGVMKRRHSGATADGPTWSAWWPSREREDGSSLEWVEQ